MMDARTLRADLYRRGVYLAAGSTGIEVDAPEGVLTDADCAALHEHKPALLQLLARAVTVHAPALGCDVLCVETLDDIPDGYAGPVYTRAELERMRGLPPEDVRDIHELKDQCGGEYEGRSDNPDPPPWKPGDRVRGYDGERWRVGTVQSVLPDDEHTAPDCAGLVIVRLDHTPYETAFRAARLWPVENEAPPHPTG